MKLIKKAARLLLTTVVLTGGASLSGCAGVQSVASPLRTMVIRGTTLLHSYSANKTTPVGTPVIPRSLNILQQGLHDCGSIAMLESWARLHPEAARSLVRQQRNGSFRIYFPDGETAAVDHEDLAAARKVRLAEPRPDDPWGEVVLTAFTRIKSGSQKLDWKEVQWCDAGDMGRCLTRSAAVSFKTKPDSTPGPTGPVSLETLHKQLCAIRGRPACAYTNKYIHIWSILNYDVRRQKVRARNPRRRTAVWIPLQAFQQQFQLLEWMDVPPVPVPAFPG